MCRMKIFLRLRTRVNFQILNFYLNDSFQMIMKKAKFRWTTRKKCKMTVQMRILERGWKFLRNFFLKNVSSLSTIINLKYLLHFAPEIVLVNWANIPKSLFPFCIFNFSDVTRVSGQNSEWNRCPPPKWATGWWKIMTSNRNMSSIRRIQQLLKMERGDRYADFYVFSTVVVFEFIFKKFRF